MRKNCKTYNCHKTLLLIVLYIFKKSFSCEADVAPISNVISEETEIM